MIWPPAEWIRFLFRPILPPCPQSRRAVASRERTRTTHNGHFHPRILPTPQRRRAQIDRSEGGAIAPIGPPERVGAGGRLRPCRKGEQRVRSRERREPGNSPESRGTPGIRRTRIARAARSHPHPVGRYPPRAASNAPSRSASPARGRGERAYPAAGPRAPATTDAGCARSLGSVRQRSNAVTRRWGIPPGGRYPHVPP